MMSVSELAALLSRLEGILERVEAVLPPAPPPPDWTATAFRWRKRSGRGFLQAVRHPHAIRLDDLVAIFSGPQGKVVFGLELVKQLRQGLPSG